MKSRARQIALPATLSADQAAAEQHYYRLRYILSCLFFIILLAAAAPNVFGDDANEQPEKVKPVPPDAVEELPVLALTDELFKKIEHDSPDKVWEAVNRLVRLSRSNGAVVVERLEKELESKSQKIRLACARALCQLDNIGRAAPVLTTLLQDGESPEVRRMAANTMGLTRRLYGDDSTTTTLVDALKKETDELTRISIARSLWRIGSHNDGRDALLKSLSQSTDKDMRDEAALVLAENGFMHLSEVRMRLLNLFNEPTAQGERAFNLLRHAEEDASRNRDPRMVQGEELLREVLRTIKLAYPDQSKVDLDKLYEDAAKGIVGGLDPFSQYMDREEVRATQEMLTQDYGGIGAYVGLRNGSFVITSPIYGSPADRAGLRAMDVIQEVDGVKTGEMVEKGGLNGVISRLKGKPGTPVRLKYYRRGFAKAIELTVVRETIRVESVFSAVLPGNIGYVRLTRFGEHSAEEMQAALDKLFNQEKVRGIVFDMRDNPGGLLRAGVEIADKFLDANKLIVYSEGNPEFAPRKDYFSTGGPEDEAYPLVALVGSGSASASEIVAGALQDHKRAPLIGEKTYGKGSVQQIMPVRSTDRQTQLRLTVAKYYLPLGRCIHEKGIDADIEVKPPEMNSWTIEKIAEMRRQNVFEDYVRDSWDSNKELYSKLAINDGRKVDAWPGLNDFYKNLDTKLDLQDIRNEVRMVARRRVQDEQKRELIVDLQEDDVLQRGALEILKKLNVDPATIAEYKDLPTRHKPVEGAMLLKDPAKQ